MLKDKFYLVSEFDTGEGYVHATIDFQEEHPIFAGHFPGKPVVPGVCMVQMVRELLETATRAELRLSHADNVKFLSVMDPGQHRKIRVDVTFHAEGEGYDTKATMSDVQTTFFKFNGNFVVRS